MAADRQASQQRQEHGSGRELRSEDENVQTSLEACYREPIHIPGSIQPHGVLLTVREDDLTVAQVSANAPALVGLDVQDIVGFGLAAVLGRGPAEAIERHAQSFTDLRERNPLHIDIPLPGSGSRQVDAVLHRTDGRGDRPGRLVIELEVSDGPRPFSFPNTYQAVRAAAAEMTAELTLQGLFDITARRVRELTGFDRVMIYRFDADFNGEVVAEDRRDDLEAFLGLHYPASDIPPQARALYEKNWLRIIPDVEYRPVPLVPAQDPDAAEPLDLTYSVLRSVSPVHVEYLRNMGVRASMSITLLRDGRLWGLIACHHYTGPHLPPFGVRAAAEFLGTTLSLRLVDRSDDETQHAALLSERELAVVASRLADQSRPLSLSLTDDTFRRDFVPADILACLADGRLETSGGAVPLEAMEVVHRWVERTAGQEPASTDHVARDLPELSSIDPKLAGVLAVALPGGATVAWFRYERLQTVDWGGDPHGHVVHSSPGEGVSISPRQSFERWREIIRDHSQTWAAGQVRLAARLRALLVEAMFARERTRAQAAEVLQLSLLPDVLPEVSGWRISAWYQPAPGGQVGGDWYDAVRLPDGRMTVVVGDVAGHGLDAAGVMARFSNTLRAFLLRGDDPASAVEALDAIVAGSYPDQMATLSVATFAPYGSEVEIISMGHLPAVHVSATRASAVPGPQGPPLGLAIHPPTPFRIALGDGDSLLMFSDGLVERRDEPLDVGLRRLQEALQEIPAQEGDKIIDAVRDPVSDDDQTLVVVSRGPFVDPGMPADRSR